MIKTLISCMSLPLLCVGATSVLSGTACAMLMGNFEFLPAVLCLVFVLLAQIAANLAHRYFELRMNGVRKDAYAGGLTHAALPPETLLREATIAFSIFAAIAGFSLVSFIGWYGLVIGAVLLIFIRVYNWGSHPLSRSPYSLVIAFITFGPIGVITTCFAQSSHFTGNPWTWIDLGPAVMLSIIVGLMAVNTLITHNITHFYGDVYRHRHTIVVTWGIPVALTIYFVNCAIIWGVSLYTCLAFRMHNIFFDMLGPTVGLIAFLILGIMLTKKKYQRDLRMEDYASYVMLALGIMAVVNFYIIGKPDDSTTTFFGSLMGMP